MPETSNFKRGELSTKCDFKMFVLSDCYKSVKKNLTIPEVFLRTNLLFKFDIMVMADTNLT